MTEILGVLGIRLRDSDQWGSTDATEGRVSWHWKRKVMGMIWGSHLAQVADSELCNEPTHVLKGRGVAPVVLHARCYRLAAPACSCTSRTECGASACVHIHARWRGVNGGCLRTRQTGSCKYVILVTRHDTYLLFLVHLYVCVCACMCVCIYYMWCMSLCVCAYAW